MKRQTTVSGSITCWRRLGAMPIALLPMLAFGQAATTDRASGGLENIVVTARRVSEDLQTTPVAVTALTADAMEDLNITGVYDVQFSTPNLVIAPFLWNSGAAVAIRGQLNENNQANTDPAVGIYVDGVYVARSSGGLLDLVDVERVEVLRGPQGTLFGRNTTGGALNIVTPAPHGELDGFVQGTLGNFSLREVLGAVNLPIKGDALAMRVSFKHTEHDGYGRNSYLGTELDDLDKDFVRASLRIAPSGQKWDLTLSGDYSTWETSGQVASLIAVRPGSVATLVPVAAPVSAGDALNNYITDDYSRSYAGVDTPGETDIWGVSATLNVDLGFGQFKSISAARGAEIHYFTDNDGTPYTIIGTEASIKQKHQYTQELQLSGSAMDTIDWITGLFYFEEENTDGNPFLANLVPIGPPANRQIADLDNTSYALYAQGTYSFTPALRLTAGLRYTEDERKADISVFRLASGACVLNVITVPGECRSQLEADFDYVAYTASLDYQLTDTNFVYVKTSRAQRSGGFNTRTVADAFRPEEVTDYEIGIKADLLNRRLRANAAVFYSYFDDAQRQVTTVDRFTNTSTSLIENAAEARMKGGELELTAIPFDGLELNATVGYVDPSYKRYIEPATGIDLSDRPFTFVSKHTYSAGATYRAPVGFGELSLHADYGYQTRKYFATTPGLADLNSQPAFGVLNSRITLMLDDPNLEIALWGKNLLDEEYDTFRLDVYNALGTVTAFRGAPRTYGLSLTYRM
jgi:iron complex outermembrane recepter protein